MDDDESDNHRKAESKARRAVEDAKDAERRAKDAERRAKDAEKRAADALAYDHSLQRVLSSESSSPRHAKCKQTDDARKHGFQEFRD